MAVHYGLDFAIFYACLLALFGYFAFWYVPLAARAVFVLIRSWVKSPPPRSDDQHFWFEGHSQ